MRALAIGLVLVLAPAARALCPPEATTATYLQSSFGVGVRTLDLVDRSRRTPPHAGLPGSRVRTLAVEVWYPAAPGEAGPVRDAPLAAERPFPLVVNSPGLLDSRGGELYYTAHLAGRGFVVASIDFPLTRGGVPGGPDLADFHNQPGDVRFVIDQLPAALASAGRVAGAWGRWEAHRRDGALARRGYDAPRHLPSAPA